MSGKPDAPTSPPHPNPKQPTKRHLQIQPLTLLQRKSCAADFREGVIEAIDLKQLGRELEPQFQLSLRLRLLLQRILINIDAALVEEPVFHGFALLDEGFQQPRHFDGTRSPRIARRFLSHNKR